MGDETNRGGRASADTLVAEFQDLGLSPYEARVLTVLLEVGSANSVQLARLAKVPRTSTYAILESLGDKGVVQRLPGEGPATWTAVARDDVLERLEAVLAAAQEERLRQHRARSARVREVLAQALPEAPATPRAYIHLLTCASQARAAEERLMNEATAEVLGFRRAPWPTPADEPDATLRGAPGRGVSTRMLYQAAQVEDPEAESVRELLAADQGAGVENRVVDELATRFMVGDRRVAVVAMMDPFMFDAGFPVTIVIEHPGVAQLLAELFELKWAAARPALPPTIKAITSPPADTNDG
ncbi:MAG TPA: helix-turn-helix domain-containing protein [Acidimicrobiales bacterium]|nr:helix-turn-helix domain-containing protein [Acidimicrobiales bacterium]